MLYNCEQFGRAKVYYYLNEPSRFLCRSPPVCLHLLHWVLQHELEEEFADRGQGGELAQEAAGVDDHERHAEEDGDVIEPVHHGDHVPLVVAVGNPWQLSSQSFGRLLRRIKWLKSCVINIAMVSFCERSQCRKVLSLSFSPLDNDVALPPDDGDQQPGGRGPRDGRPGRGPSPWRGPRWKDECGSYPSWKQKKAKGFKKHETKSKIVGATPSIYWIHFETALCFPTDPFTILQSRDSSIDAFEEQRVLRSTHFEALKLWKGR